MAFSTKLRKNLTFIEDYKKNQCQNIDNSDEKRDKKPDSKNKIRDKERL